MKKAISLLLITMLVLTQSVGVSAKENVNLKKLNNNEIELLTELGININQIEIIDLNVMYTRDELKKIRNEMTKSDDVEILHIIFKSTRDISEGEITIKSDIPEEGGAYYYEEIISHTYPTETLNDSSAGMKYWADKSFSVAIGFISPWIWVPATVLDINLSDLCPDYQTGDVLRSTQQEVYHHRHYKQYSPVLGYEKNMVRTSKLYSKVYVDLYTIDKYGEPVRKNEFEMKTFYSEHYFDTDWIYDMCDYYANIGYSLEHYDDF